MGRCRISLPNPRPQVMWRGTENDGAVVRRPLSPALLWILALPTSEARRRRSRRDSVTKPRGCEGRVYLGTSVQTINSKELRRSCAARNNIHKQQFNQVTRAVPHAELECDDVSRTGATSVEVEMELRRPIPGSSQARNLWAGGRNPFGCFNRRFNFVVRLTMGWREGNRKRWRCYAASLSGPPSMGWREGETSRDDNQCLAIWVP